jgi:hypothetical protein
MGVNGKDARLFDPQAANTRRRILKSHARPLCRDFWIWFQFAVMEDGLSVRSTIGVARGASS